MLPDFLKTKDKLKRMIRSEVKKSKVLHMGAFGDVPQTILFEGHRSTLIRDDGSCEDIQMKRARAEVEVKIDEIEELTHEKVLDKIDVMARELAKKFSKTAVDTLKRASEDVGNVVSADGEPFSIDILLQGMEKMHLSFDEDGQVRGIQFIANPKMKVSYEKIFSEVENDPRYKELIERKREEWRVRENNRKLVG